MPETGWIIAMGLPIETAVYVTLENGLFRITDNPSRALRFSRALDAEAFSKLMLSYKSNLELADSNYVVVGLKLTVVEYRGPAQ